MTGKRDPLEEKRIAQENWDRYVYARGRGHREYCRLARRLEDYYLGGGSQWSEEDKAVLQEQRRPALEFNEIMPAINAAIGYQIANRMELGFAPRGGMATQETATVLSKVSKQVADNVDLHWRETDVYSDGLIQQRGYFELRIHTDDHMRGEIQCSVLDPMDVLPDPDAKSYDPNDWADVTITRWLTLDEIEQRYGADARKKVEDSVSGNNSISEADYGEADGDEEPRNKFGMDQGAGERSTSMLYDAVRRDRHLIRVRIVDRQKFELVMSQVLVMPDTGDVRVVEGMEPEALQALMDGQGGILTKRMAKRVRWIVSTWDELLHDDYSPYPFLTVVPYFPYFRRGRTRGMVDNGMGPQDALNKSISQYVHIVNSIANSGWMVEENSLTNMDSDDLEENGAKTGLVLEYKKGSAKPEKIQPNRVPEGLDRIIDRLTNTLKDNTVPDAARGIDGGEKSGIAIQSRQYAAQQQLAIALDNLARTRRMVADRILWFLQRYYDDERIIRITKQNPETGQPEDEELRINYPDPATGQILNDLRIGEYDVIVTEQPQQVTFENSQFEQARDLRKLGVDIPDDVLVRNSNLAEKADLLQRMSSQPAKSDPLAEAEVALKMAQAEKTRNEAVNASVEGQYSAIQTAQTIAQMPATAPLADSLLKSAGFVDQDAAPIVPSADVAGALGDVPPAPANTNPLTPTNPPMPANPAVGMQDGIEGGEIGDA